jgi:hypothetical protein
MAVEQIPQPPEPSCQSGSTMGSHVFYYSPLRYLRTMLAIAWAAFAHPFSSTVIDLATGEVRHNADDERNMIHSFESRKPQPTP